MQKKQFFGPRTENWYTLKSIVFIDWVGEPEGQRNRNVWFDLTTSGPVRQAIIIWSSYDMPYLSLFFTYTLTHIYRAEQLFPVYLHQLYGSNTGIV